MKKGLIIGAVIVLLIIFVVKMSEPQDGIGSVKEEQEKLDKILQEKENADKNYQEALDNYIESKENLEKLEKGQ